MNAKNKKKPLALELLDDLFSDDKSAEINVADSIPSIEIVAENQPARQAAAPNVPDKNALDLSNLAQVEPDEASEKTNPPVLHGTETRDVGYPTMTEKLDEMPTVERDTASFSVSQTPHRLNANTAGVVDVRLAQSENLRFAQEKILDLEGEVERLRRENEELAAAGETLRKRADELLSKSENLELRMRESQDDFGEEKIILLESLSGKEKLLEESQMKIEELEMRLNVNIKKIRVRERELENRLELVKMESSAVVRNKDEIILDLKRQVDQLSHELENYRQKGQELNKRLTDRQEVLRRTVRALRLALTMVEGSDAEIIKKKAE